jgi:hypothetical protein
MVSVEHVAAEMIYTDTPFCLTALDHIIWIDIPVAVAAYSIIHAVMSKS